MNRPLDVHLRLLAELAPHIRTHERRAVMPHCSGFKYTPHEKENLRERLLRLQAMGLNRKQMAHECGTTNKTIVRLLGNVRPKHDRAR